MFLRKGGENIPERSHHFDSQKQRSFWEGHIVIWQQSRLSQFAYCREHQLKPHRFYYWRRRILKRQPDVSFLPVTLPADTLRHPQFVRILLSNGCALELGGGYGLERVVAVVVAL